MMSLDKTQKKSTQTSRIGNLFHYEIIEIQKAMYKEKGFVSSEKITNLIIKHKKYWGLLKGDLINASMEEIDNANK